MAKPIKYLPEQIVGPNTPPTGVVAFYAKDDNKLYKKFDNGVEEVVGDITSVTAGTNLNGGGTTGDVTVNLDAAITDMDSVGFNLLYTPSGAEPVGTIYWNEDERTFDVRLTTNVTGQMFEELFFGSKNQTGSTISDGTPVMFGGALGNSGRILMQPAIADDSIPPEYIMGITTESVDNGEDGKVTWFGKIKGIDTTGTPYGETWNDGDLLFVSATTAGALTNVAPEAPNRRILVAAVIKAHSNGTLQSRPSWHPKVVDLDDVNGTPLTTSGQIMEWDDINSYFDFTKNINDYLTIADAESDFLAIDGSNANTTINIQGQDLVGINNLNADGTLTTGGSRVKSTETSTTTATISDDVEEHECNGVVDYSLTMPTAVQTKTLSIVNIGSGTVTLVGPINSATAFTYLKTGESCRYKYSTTNNMWN
jgi:hypothetical protein